jgi:hypothetical protein
LSTEFSYLPPDLRLRVFTELLDQRYSRRTHAHRKTFDAGCRGPLCLLAGAQHREGVRRAKAASRGKPYRQRPGRRTFDIETEALVIRAQNEYRRAREPISA